MKIMDGANRDGQQKTWRNGIRPLLYWLLLVLVLFGIRLNERLLENTRLYFSVSMNGQFSQYPFKVTLDGKPVESGDNISLGSHQFAIVGPQTDLVSMDLNIFYGKHDLGNIHLKRSTGTLSINATPAAQTITIRGSEFSTNISDGGSISLVVPTDTYSVRVQYPFWSDAQTAAVVRDTTVPVSFAPKFGTLHVTCNRDGAAFQLQDSNQRIIESGNMPGMLTEIPVGTYELTATHHHHQLQQSVTLEANFTNYVPIDFEYGGAVLETEPAGATVRTSDGQYLGVTPLTLAELTPGSYMFLLQHDGYEAVTATLAITTDQTTPFQTNLVSVNYTASMKIAQQDMDSEDYDNALLAVNNALLAKPGDADALELQRNATGLGSIQRAKALGTQGDFFGGEKKLAAAIQELPENTEAPALLAEYKRREPEQIERMRVERLERPKKSFDSIVNQITGAAMFESHELTTSNPAVEVQPAIVAQLKSAQPTFQINSDETPATETFEIEATQVFSGGSRQCVIVGGQSKDDETQIYFTVVESKKVGFFNQPITSLVGATPLEYTLIDPNQPQLSDKLKNQIAEGVTNVTAIIQGAIAQTPATQPAVPQ
jgi:hypothetical protein